MPGSRVRRSTRKREPPHKFEPAEASSPSRPVKRRRASVRGSPRIDALQEPQHEQEAEEQTSEAEDEEEIEKTELERVNEQVEAFIPHLREGPEPINAQQQHPNVDRFVRAVAKIAGRQWTFYTRSPCINLGRQGDKKTGKLGDEKQAFIDEQIPDIDLGPGKHVSREHAEIRYEDDERWHLTVIGRNGAKVNDVLVKKGQHAVIQSGDVIEIAGTEMLFVSAVSPAEIQQVYLERLKYAPEQLKPPSFQQSEIQWSTLTQTDPSQKPTHNFQQTSSHFISPYGPPVPYEFSGITTSERPSTPTSALVQQHPYLAQQMNQSRGKPMTLESSEQIDYSSDANKDVKPPMSYATLIAQAILAGANERSSLSGIYEWIKKNFAYYRHIEPGWQNSIRHNLSLNQAFDKVARESHEPGKGGMWFIVPEKKDDFKRMGWKMTSRGGARPSSNPSSPAPPKNRSPKRRTPPRSTVSGHENLTPAPGQRHTVESSQTPLRQTTNAITASKVDPTPQLIDDNSPLPMRQSFLGNNTNTTGSPTMLSSSFLDESGVVSGHFANPFTPAPRRQEPSFNAPSTAKLPSQYLLQSSPAPFWKDFETPSALPQTSPVKAYPIPSKDVPASSSPPREGANESPSRTRTKSDVGLGIQETGKMGKDQPEAGQLDLMGSFPKIGDSRAVNPAH